MTVRTLDVVVLTRDLPGTTCAEATSVRLSSSTARTLSVSNLLPHPAERRRW